MPILLRSCLVHPRRFYLVRVIKLREKEFGAQSPSIDNLIKVREKGFGVQSPSIDNLIKLMIGERVRGSVS